MCQGIEYYHALKSNNNMRLTSSLPPETTSSTTDLSLSDPSPTIPRFKCMIFPEDTHAIDKPASSLAHWKAVQEWFDKFINE